MMIFLRGSSLKKSAIQVRVTMEHSKGFGQSKVTQISALSDDVDIFDSGVTENHILSGRTISLQPQSGDGDFGPCQWYLQPQGADQYLQLNSIRLAGQARVVKGDGTVLANTVDIGSSNIPGHSIWRGHEIEINNTLVTDLSSFSAHYQAYMQYVLSYGANAADTHLASQRFKMDTPGKFDTCKVEANDTDKNHGYEARSAYMKGSKYFDFYIPICADILQSDRLLHSSASLSLKLMRESDEFTLMSDTPGSYKIQLKGLKLFAHYVKVSEQLVKKHQMLFQKNSIVYPITRTTMKNFHLTQGESSRYLSNVFMGQIPKSIVIGMVSDEAATGNLKKNPYNFQHFNLKEAYLKLNGEMVPSDPLAPDFANGLVMREFMELHRNVGIDSNEDHGNLVNLKQFAGGSFFMAFDLTGHRCNMMHKHKTMEGNLDISLTFASALSENVRVIVDAQVEISKSNGVVVNYN